MNYRKWPVQSVLWLITSVSLFIVYVGSDLYRWKVRGKPFGLGELVDSFIFSVVAGWATTLSSTARGIGILTWLVSVVLTFVAGFKLENNVHLSPLVDTVCGHAFVLFPLLIAVGAMLLRQRRERIKINAMR